MFQCITSASSEVAVKQAGAEGAEVVAAGVVYVAAEAAYVAAEAPYVAQAVYADELDRWAAPLTV